MYLSLVSNTGDAPLQAVFAGIADVLCGSEPAWPKALAAEAVRRIASEQGSATAVARYQQLQASAAGEYEFTEGRLNSLGYQTRAAARSSSDTHGSSVRCPLS